MKKSYQFGEGRLQQQLRQTATKTKELFRARPIGQCGRRRRCLHGLCHGSQWPWLTSPVLSASPAVARARRAFNHLHLLVSSGSANNSVSFCRELLLLWACPLHGTETVHGGTCGACAEHQFALIGCPGQKEIVQKASAEICLGKPLHDGHMLLMCVMAVGPQCGS